MSEPPDTVLRAITDDGAFRVITARTTETVRGAIEAQGVTGQTARHFGDLLTGSILFRETMAPNLRVQGIIKGSNGSGSLIADSHPSGQTRGLVQLKGGAREIDLGQGAVLQLMRTLGSGRINQGVVEVPKDGGISHSFMSYMQTSEQVISMLAVGTLFDGDRVHSAGGYIVQLLPEVGRGPLMVMTERLRDFESIDQQLGDSAFTPSWLLDELLYGMPFTRLEESSVRFECWCDELRVVSALASLSRDDLEHLLSSNEVLEIACEYCKRDFRIAPARLRGLLEQS
ncbi:MAG TPA: Hsp33 family molecular chaperone HslO [Polyangiaceae bacterium]|nr:Hsp33 family molecular chaperone HslO [Polyangiaceae bacterium]